jgi:hypothetical protein
MAGKTITGTVSKTVTIGSGGFYSPLTIAGTGVILPGSPGATGIYLPARPTLVTIVNHGLVYGAAGVVYEYAGSVGGTAIVLESGVLLTNTDVIAGGRAGGTYADTAGHGGNGIAVEANATIVNSALITGGSGAYGRYDTGAGGVGITFATNATLTNSGTIDGGNGGNSYYKTRGQGEGGIAIVAAQEAVLTNTGSVTGGAGGLIGHGTAIAGAGGGVGLDISNGSTLTNSGHVTGGAGGGGAGVAYGGYGVGGIYLRASTVTNTGTIAGGAGGAGAAGGGGGLGAYAGSYGLLINKAAIIGGSGAAGGTVSGGSGNGGVFIGTYATVNNSGHITGGIGGNEVTAYLISGSGGDGVILDSGLLTNSGTISGADGGSDYGDRSFGEGRTLGVGSGYGGTGVEAFNFFSGAERLSIVNYGLIKGGNGGYISGYGGIAGGGGRGVSLRGGTLTNKGVILGGTGGDVSQRLAADYGNGGIARQGGAGVYIDQARVVNTGKITGGTGGTTVYSGTTGGAGVYLEGGTLVTSGTITGGAGGVSQAQGAQGDAVYVTGSIAGTVIINPGAVFNGNVVADTAVANVLEFAGSSTGTVQGIGTKFTGFAFVSFASGASRGIEGTISAFYDVAGLAPHDTIILDNFTDNLAATTISQQAIGLSMGGTTTHIYMPERQFNNLLITDAGGKTTIAPVIGTFAHTLTTGMEQYVLSGSTSTSLLKTGGVEEIYSGGIAAKTTISGGELELQIGAKISGGVTFGTGGGELKIDSSIMPTATISGFSSGDTIDLAGVIYNKYDTVTVATAGIVSVVTPSKTYSLNIAGATVGEKDFVFGAGSLLTKSTPLAPKMQFIAPASNPQVSSYWLDAPADVTAPIAAEPAEPVAAFTSISTPSTGVGFTDLRDSILHISLASWIPHG